MNEREPPPSNSDAVLDKPIAVLKEYLDSHPQPAPSLEPRRETDPHIPCWNIISLLSPIIVGWPALAIADHYISDSGWGWGAIGIIFVATVATSLAGLITAIIAFVRRERFAWLTALELIIYGGVVLQLLLLLIQ